MTQYATEKTGENACSDRTRCSLTDTRLFILFFATAILAILLGETPSIGAQTHPAKIAKEGLQQPTKTPRIPSCLLALGQNESGSIACIAPNNVQSSFIAAKKKLSTLRNDSTRSCWRQPWEKLRNTFLSIYVSRTDRDTSSQALFLAAQCQEALARCSHLGEDYRTAVNLFEAVANDFPNSRSAGDALAKAINISRNALGDESLARKLTSQLAKISPAAAATFEKKSQSQSRTATHKNATPELVNISWDSLNRDLVEVVLEFSSPVKLSARLVRQQGPGRIVLNLQNTDVVSEIRRGISIRNSLLTAVKVQTMSKQRTDLIFDFESVKRFETRYEQNSTRIILTAGRKLSQMPEKDKTSREYATTSRERAAAQVVSLPGIASGGIRTVTIDPGHGGHDPGAVHNGVIESAVTLDIAMRLGTLLQNNGLRVIYTRKSNRSVSLAERCRLANENRSDLFVSIHVNSNPEVSASGFETYYLAPSPQKGNLALAARENNNGRSALRIHKIALSSRALNSQRLAFDVQRRSIRRLDKSGYDTENNGVKAGPFFVLGASGMPAILAEIGYSTNKTEARLLLTPNYRQSVAEGLAEGILAYRDRFLSRTTADNSSTDKNWLRH